jgi:hypothetical protein
MAMGEFGFFSDVLERGELDVPGYLPLRISVGTTTYPSSSRGCGVRSKQVIHVQPLVRCLLSAIGGRT